MERGVQLLGKIINLIAGRNLWMLLLGTSNYVNCVGTNISL